MEAAAGPLEALVVPVNSAAHWSHLYVEDDGAGEDVIDLTSTSRPVDLRTPVSTPT